jgi:hypothetical protein
VTVGGTGVGGTVTILWSSDGKTWNIAENGFSGGENYGNKVVFGYSPSGPLWVTVGYGVNTILWSENGKSWNPAKNGFGAYVVGYDVSFGYSPSGSPVWVAVGEGATKIIMSTDGKTWTPAIWNGDNIYGIAFGYSHSVPLWVAVGVRETTPLTIVSSDGLTWKKAGSTDSSVIGISYAGSSLWMAVGFGTIAITRSPNDKQWEVTGTTPGGRSVAYGNGTWITVGGVTNTILRSTDGETWQYIRGEFSNDGHGVAYRIDPPRFESLPRFLKGTRILTPSGYKRIEDIHSGEHILTSDKRSVKANVYTYQLRVNSETAPYKIPAGVLGHYLPSRDLHISGNHAIQDGYGIWHIPKHLAQKNMKIQQHSLGESVTYSHIECPNSVKYNLIVEGVTVESLKIKEKVWKVTEPKQKVPVKLGWWLSR